MCYGPSDRSATQGDLSTIIPVEPSSTDASRLQGALPLFDSCTAAWTALLNHLIGVQEDRRWDGEAEGGRAPNPKRIGERGWVAEREDALSLGESERVA